MPEFDWWLLIVGFVAGAGLLWLILARLPRADADETTAERRAEAAWIAEQLGRSGPAVDVDAAEEVLDLHRRYLDAGWVIEPLTAEEGMEVDAAPIEPAAQSDEPGRSPGGAPAGPPAPEGR